MQPADVYRQRHNLVAQAPSTARRQSERTDERRLRIAMLAPPWIPVPPPGYHGAKGSLVCCRQTAAERFAPDRVALGYEAVYLDAVRRGALAPAR